MVTSDPSLGTSRLQALLYFCSSHTLVPRIYSTIKNRGRLGVGERSEPLVTARVQGEAGSTLWEGEMDGP